jgi:hypothetical protein
MSAKQKQSGFASIVIILVLIIIIAAAFFLKDTLLAKFKNIKTDQSIDEIKKETKDWQTYNFKYGQINIKYPEGWVVRSPDNYPSDYKYVDFLPVKEGSQISNSNIITVSAGIPYVEPFYETNVSNEVAMDNFNDSSYSGTLLPPPPLPPLDQDVSMSKMYPSQPYIQPNNFNIPALGAGDNAFFNQQQDQTVITFKKDGVDYTLIANIYSVLQEKMDPAEVTATLTKMAKSVSFTQELSSCDNFVLKPLTTFPENFVLANSYRSDKKDQVMGYTLDINTNIDKYSLEQTARSNSDRIFTVAYKKDGQPMEKSEDLMKGIVNIEGRGDIWSNNLSVLYLVNCADYLTKPNVTKDYRIYRIGNSNESPFNLELYASADNPNKLWGAKEWNINLLKQTRGTVYAKMGDKLQKYTATNYYATLK